MGLAVVVAAAVVTGEHSPPPPPGYWAEAIIIAWLVGVPCFGALIGIGMGFLGGLIRKVV
jgi:hypothetical protein